MNNWLTAEFFPNALPFTFPSKTVIYLLWKDSSRCVMPTPRLSVCSAEVTSALVLRLNYTTPTEWQQWSNENPLICHYSTASVISELRHISDLFITSSYFCHLSDKFLTFHQFKLWLMKSKFTPESLVLSTVRPHHKHKWLGNCASSILRWWRRLVDESRGF